MEKSATPATGKVSNHIPDDVAISILSNLPLKSLKRFESTCKSWSMLFQNPYFMKIYRNRIIQGNHSDHADASLILRHTIVLDNVVRPVVEPLFQSTLYFISGEKFENRVKLNLSLPFQVLGQDIYILGSISINGFLCLSNLLDDERKAVLWNPTTKEFIVIPSSPVESLPYRKFEAFIHGFGYDHVMDDYKVIRYVEFDSLSFYDIMSRGLSEQEASWKDVPMEPLWEIYSLRSNSWKKLDVDMSMVMSPETREETVRFYMDGMCHWWDKIEKDSDDGETYFVSFDVTNEVCFTTPMPSDIDDTFDIRLVKRQLVMLNRSIGLISYSGETNTLHVSILGEIGVKESWTKLFIVGSLPHVKYPIEAGKNGDIFFIKKDGELACFNLDTQTIKELGVEGDMSQIVIYKESFHSIRSIHN
ncbi:putative F-box domain-containing protein [Medicago truncatula]|uniref:F-box protein interaction domain protein n=1 Tax=Medicago truncatula TaxID=3880 RepID=G7ILN1_MEDTR|nr:F-box/kelch-repeat protein At3g06240 [Medicago truncatula]AES64386.2 F-box protein interaction domain protein [Medicago truncatula]RHN72425.1 putative F-box domain-containing protein [Medicago truncatula]